MAKHIKILSSGHTDTSGEKFIILTILILLIKKTILILLIMFKGENIEQFRNILLYNNLLNAATTWFQNISLIAILWDFGPQFSSFNLRLKLYE